MTIVTAERGERGALCKAPSGAGRLARADSLSVPSRLYPWGVGSIVLLIGVAVVCVGIGAAAAFAFAPPVYASRSNGITAGSTLEDDGVVPVLAALRSTVVVLDDDDEVLRASANAYTYNIVRDDQVCEPHVAEMVARVRAGGAPEETELTVARGRVAGAGQFYLYVRVAAIGGGRILVLIEDRTAAKRLEDMRRDFVANVSHELKTPVGAIALLAETVEEAVDDPDLVRNYVGRIRRETTRLGVLVQEIMELSRLQEGDALVEPDDVDLDAVVAEALDRVRTEAEAKEVTLISGGTPGLHVRGDAALITTAVRNLLDNAIRYSDPRTRVSVGISIDRTGAGDADGAGGAGGAGDDAGGAGGADGAGGAGGSGAASGAEGTEDAEDAEGAAAAGSADELVRIAVVDQGIGIAKEAQERVFERFYRVDKARSRATGGTGLGLSIVKHVAADHGGTVELWSTPGRGSTFTLVLPLLIPDPPDPAGADPQAEAAVASGAAGAAFAAIAAISEGDQA